MIRRRDILGLSLAAIGSKLLGRNRALAQSQELLKYLCPPDGATPDLVTRPSPPTRPFVAPFNVLPAKQPVPRLDPPPDPRAHQRYEEFLPKKFYEIRESEFRWVYHPDAPYNAGSWSWGFDGITPGPTYYARYGEPILVRRLNTLPNVGQSNVTFALPKTTNHLHNGHTASESDGYPMDFIGSGEYWDHQYCNFPSGMDNREKLSTLWYHDHMMDFTASNVYAGLSGFYLLFDEQDTGYEDTSSEEYKRVAQQYGYDPAKAWGLPSGKYDIPMVLHDVLFDSYGQASFNPFNTDGILGDKFTVNRIIQPYLQVEPRKYRFRILNGGPSRFYQLFLSTGQPFVVITGDGNVLPKPVVAESLYLSVAQRCDVIVDFSRYQPGDQIILQNRLEQTNGKGPSGRMLEPGDGIIRFDVVKLTAPDKSRVPDQLRPLPPMPEDLSKFKHRVWVFDYMAGLWTINGQVFDHNRIDAEIEQGSGEVWILRNQGKNWSHPIHSHFTEFLLHQVNGRLIQPDTIQSTEGRRHYEFEDQAAAIKVFMGGQRRDITTLLPNDEVIIFMRWDDFLGKYIMHCHNVVHEDHAMMIRWDIVPSKKPGSSSKPAPALPASPQKERIRLKAKQGLARDLKAYLLASVTAQPRWHKTKRRTSDMPSRRNLLARFTAPAAAAIPGAGFDGSDHASNAIQRASSCDCSRPHNGPYAHHFPNVVVQTHEGQRALFYDDLLRGKMVMINCMSVKNEALFPVSRNLAMVQRLLRNKLGSSLFMYSITVDPEHDTPRVLKAFAGQHGAGPGWMFLTGEPAAIQTLRSRLFVSGDSHDHGAGPAEDCSLALIRYGNEAVGLWGSVPAKTDPELIAMRISWIQPEQPWNGTPRRAGPKPLV